MAKKYIDADLLKAEIEKRKSLFSNEKEKEGVSKTDKLSLGARIAMLEELLSFLDTLQEPEVDLEKEIETYFKGWYMDETDQGYILHTPDDHAGLMSVKQIARHFYEFGKQSKEPVSENLEKKECELVNADEDIITIHLGKVLTEEQYDAVLRSVIDHLNKHWWHILRWSA